MQQPKSPFLRCTFALIHAAFLLSPALARAAGAEHDVDVAPAPDWVTRAPAPLSSTGGTAAIGGIIEEFLDEEVRLGKTVERYRRRVERLTSTAGVEAAGQIEVSFDPSYEHLTLHALSITRGRERINALEQASIRALQKEQDLDERVYNGSLTALVVVKDLRVGDTLDLEYTIEGANPVFGGRLVDSEPLTTPRGAERLRVRLVSPADRPIVAHSVGVDLAPVERVEGGVRELVWERAAVPPPPEEDRIPSWSVTYPYVSFSEFPTWSDVARWAVPIFARAAETTPPIAAKAAEIAASAGGLEARALAALRFVQDDVRYLGIEMGANSHRPHDAAQVLDQRFGDCKDKAVLLVSLLRALGIEAAPALVDAWAWDHVSSRPPSPFAFNHAIVRLKLAGREVWVDPTRSEERGPLGSAVVPYGRALIVEPFSTDLATIPFALPVSPTMHSRQIFSFDGRDASLDVTTTYLGSEADRMRQRLVRIPPEKIGADALNYYLGIYPAIEAVRPAEVADDPLQDRIVVSEHYALKDPLGQGGLDVTAEVIRDLVRKPQVSRRTIPLAVPYPVYRRDEVVVKGISLYGADDKVLHDDAIDFTRRGDTTENVTKLTFELRTKRDSVPPDGVAAHVALLGEIRDSIYGSLGVREVKKTRAESRQNLIALGWIVGAGVFAFGVSVAVPRIRRRRWAKKVRASAGETAALAQEAPDRAAAERILLAGKCTCGGAVSPGVEWSTLTYGGREVTAGRAACSACGERRVRYFQGALSK
ncbi:MAG TPA: DUF3857 domain-containing transglutaminase family protein [Polyangiaceae bacterium]